MKHFFKSSARVTALIIFIFSAVSAQSQEIFPGEIAFVKGKAQVRKYANDTSEAVKKENVHSVVVINWTADDQWAFVAVSNSETGYIRRKDIVLSGMTNDPFRKSPPENKAAFRALAAHNWSPTISESPTAYVSKVLALEGITVSPKADVQFKQGKKVKRVTDARVGDRVYFKDQRDVVGIFLSGTRVLIIKKPQSYLQASDEKKFRSRISVIRRSST